MRDSPIIVFDSGIGSMSIIKELRRELPKENLIYFADKANFPYGNKSHTELLTIVQNTIQYLERFKPKLIIMASNTPSVQILDELIKKINIPIVGVKPPLKEAVKVTKKNHIGIMATQSTINSIQLDRQIKDEIPQTILVSKYDASPLITLIENGMFIDNKKKQKKIIYNILNDLQHIDVVTLSSTHLPFVRDQLMEMYPTIKFIDPSIIVVRNIKKLLINSNLVKKIGHGRMRILVSDKKFEFQEILRRLGIREKVEEVFWSV